MWDSLSPDQQGHLFKNTKYIIQIINQCTMSEALPFMQIPTTAVYVLSITWLDKHKLLFTGVAVCGCGSSKFNLIEMLMSLDTILEAADSSSPKQYTLKELLCCTGTAFSSNCKATLHCYTHTCI